MERNPGSLLLQEIFAQKQKWKPREIGWRRREGRGSGSRHPALRSRQSRQSRSRTKQGWEKQQGASALDKHAGEWGVGWVKGDHNGKFSKQF